MAVEQVTLHLGLPIVVGFIIGIVEAFFVYEDENMTSGKDFLGDMWHGLIFALAGTVIAANIPYFSNFIPESFYGFLFVDEATGISLVACILITLIMLIKMVASHAIKGISGAGFSEKFWHKLVIAGLVGFSPYYIFMLYDIQFLVDLAANMPWFPL